MTINAVLYFIVFFIYTVNVIVPITSNEVRKIKKYVRRANKGYFVDFGKAVNFVKEQNNLRTKLKLTKWLNRVIKHSLFSKSVKELSKQILEEYVRNNFLYFAKKKQLCKSISQIERASFYYDRRHNILFVNFYQNDIECKTKNVYIMDWVISNFFDSNQNLLALAYSYRGKIYLYVGGKVYKTRYKNISNMFFNENHNKYGFLFEDRQGSGVNINGIEYRVGERECIQLHINDDLSKWAVTCNSRKYKNKIFIRYKNYKKFIFTRINQVYFNGDGVFYVGYNDSTSRIIKHLSIVVNSKIHKRYRPTYDYYNYYGIYPVTPYDIKGSRWIYSFRGILVDTDNVKKIRLYSKDSYAVEPFSKTLYYITNKPTGGWGLFKNKRLIFTLPDNTNSPFFITCPKERCVILTYYIADQMAKSVNTHLLFIGKNRIKRYILKNKYLRKERVFLVQDKCLVSLTDYDNRNNPCFEVRNFRLKKKPDNSRLCTANYEHNINPFAITYDGNNQYITKGSTFKRKLTNIWNATDFFLRKNIIFLIGNLYLNKYYFAFINVSLHKDLEVVLKFNYNAFSFNKYNGKVFFVDNNTLYEVSLNDWVGKFLYKVRIFCLLQKRLCQLDR